MSAQRGEAGSGAAGNSALPLASRETSVAIMSTRNVAEMAVPPTAQTRGVQG